ncbi:MAG: hypothetical protein AAGB12_04730 [Pseudomonadota bacterium]
MKNILMCLSVLIMLTGCSTVAFVDKKETATIKRVAIVGYDFFVPADITLDLISGNSELSIKENYLAKKIYEDIGSELTQHFGWDIVAKNEITTSTSYQQLHFKNKNNSRTRIAVGKYVTLEGLLPGKAILKLSSAQKEQLMNELAVDALITFEVQGIEGSMTSYFDTVDITKYELEMDNFHVFKAGALEPIVHINNLSSGLPKDVRPEIDIKGIPLSNEKLSWLYASQPLLIEKFSAQLTQ